MTDRAQIFKAWFGVQTAASKVAALLYAAAGDTVTHDALLTATDQTHKGLRDSIKRLRVAMDPESVANVWGRGYRLTAVGMADCEAAIADAARERAA